MKIYYCNWLKIVKNTIIDLKPHLFYLKSASRLMQYLFTISQQSKIFNYRSSIHQVIIINLGIDYRKILYDRVDLTKIQVCQDLGRSSFIFL